MRKSTNRTKSRHPSTDYHVGPPQQAGSRGIGAGGARRRDTQMPARQWRVRAPVVPVPVVPPRPHVRRAARPSCPRVCTPVMQGARHDSGVCACMASPGQRPACGPSPVPHESHRRPSCGPSPVPGESPSAPVAHPPRPNIALHATPLARPVSWRLFPWSSRAIARRDLQTCQRRA